MKSVSFPVIVIFVTVVTSCDHRLRVGGVPAYVSKAGQILNGPDHSVKEAEPVPPNPHYDPAERPSGGAISLRIEDPSPGEPGYSLPISELRPD